MASNALGEVKPDVGKSTEGGDKSGKKKSHFRGQKNRYATPKFKGETERVHGHIYDVRQNDQAGLFTETTKKLARYAGHTYKDPQDI